MTSRRPMTRSYSGNGRSNSLNEDDSAPSSRADSRNYLSNVRPENRSTFCSVMSQLTEETQPSFETTIKSKAVSENCNVKFTCVVTGFPAPEITWYKDDAELDRYCGLPKYEISRNGKTHILHIYNCTLDDAAIYQASARNSKGIVSCSGVLEVGAMSEYKIHQNFFAKLKQKAELKRREMDESRRKGKENVQQEQLSILAQDRIMRKRRTPGEVVTLNSSDSNQDAEEIAEEATEAAAVESTTEETNGDTMETAALSTTEENGSQDANHVPDRVEIISTKQANKEKLAKKKIRISNGFEDGLVVSSPPESASGSNKHTSEGDGSFTYLYDTVQSQVTEEKQNSLTPDTPMEVDAAAVAGENECKNEREQAKEKEFEKEQQCEDERQRQREMELEKEKQQREIEREREKEKERERELEREEKEREREREQERERDKEREREQEMQLVKEIELQKERERLRVEEEQKQKERERTQEVERARQLAEAKRAAGKVESRQSMKKSNSEPQQKSALTTVLTSLKDIIFGKTKSKSIEAQEEIHNALETGWERTYPPLHADSYPSSTSAYFEPPSMKNEAYHVTATTDIGKQPNSIGYNTCTTEEITSDSQLPELPKSWTMLDSHRVPEAPKDEVSISALTLPEVCVEKTLVVTPEVQSETDRHIPKEVLPPSTLPQQHDVTTTDMHVKPTEKVMDEKEEVVSGFKERPQSSKTEQKTDVSLDLHVVTKAEAKQGGHEGGTNHIEVPSSPPPFPLQPEVSPLEQMLGKEDSCKTPGVGNSPMELSASPSATPQPAASINEQIVTKELPSKEDAQISPMEVTLSTPATPQSEVVQAKLVPVVSKDTVPTPKEEPEPSIPHTQIQAQLEAKEDHIQVPQGEIPTMEAKATTVLEYNTAEGTYSTEPVTRVGVEMLSLQGPSEQGVGVCLKDQVATNLESTDKQGYTSAGSSLMAPSLTQIPTVITTAPEEVPESYMEEISVVECNLEVKLRDMTTPIGEERKSIVSPTDVDMPTVPEISPPTQDPQPSIARGNEERKGEDVETESISEKLLQADAKSEGKGLEEPKRDVFEIHNDTPQIVVTVEDTDLMSTSPISEVTTDKIKGSVGKSQTLHSLVTEQNVEVEEMETEAIEVQPVVADYQVTPSTTTTSSLFGSQKATRSEEERRGKTIPIVDITEDEHPTKEVRASEINVSNRLSDTVQIEKISVNDESLEQKPENILSVNSLITEAKKQIVSPKSSVTGSHSDSMTASDAMLVESSLTPASPIPVVPPTQECSNGTGILPAITPAQEVAQQSETDGRCQRKGPAEAGRQPDTPSMPTIDIAGTSGAKPRSQDARDNASATDTHTVSAVALDSNVLVSVDSSTAQQDTASKMAVFAAPAITLTCPDSTPEVNKVEKKERDIESLAAILWGVKNNIDQENKAKELPVSEGLSALPPKTPTSAKTEPISQALTLQPKTPQICISDVNKSNVPKEVNATVDRAKTDKPAGEKLGVSPALPPMMSPSSLRRLMAKGLFGTDSHSTTPIPAITVDSESQADETSGGSTPTSVLSCESSPKMRRKDSPSPIPSATPEELASGARRKIFLSKAKADEANAATSPDSQGKKESPYMSPSQARRAAFLQANAGQQTPPMERRSPLLSRRKATLEIPKVPETPVEAEPVKTEVKPAERLDPFKAPQVIRKIRGEPFSDATGHLKLWCQFFNVLSDSTITWFRDEVEVLEVQRSAGDESQVALAIVQASNRDCGVYACTIKNEYGTDTTDFLLSSEILAEFLLRDELQVGEEIEMTPLLFTKGLADPGAWGDKFFGRIMTEEMHLGEGIAHKACRVKVIYGLDPIFESGSTCITKVRNLLAYGTKEESQLIDRNLQITKQMCRMQNIMREYCKIFAAEARVIENFGPALEVNPVYLVYRPANTVPYATVEAELKGAYLRYCFIDTSGQLVTKTTSEVEQKCSTFQHWIHQWTNGNLLVTQLEGVDMKVTNLRIVTKTKGYQGLSEEASPKVLEQFLTHHQCNYYCGLMGLRNLKPLDLLQQPARMKGSRSPLLGRKTGSSSPQLLRKGAGSPQPVRRITSSPKTPRKSGESGDGSSTPTTKHKTVEIPKVVRMR